MLEKTLVYSVGSAKPYLQARHVPTRDLRATLRGLVTEIGPAASRAPVAQCDPTPIDVPPSGTSGLRYREAVEAIAAMMPPGPTCSRTPETRAPPSCIIFRCSGGAIRGRARHGRHGLYASAPVSVRRSRAARARTFVIAGDGAFFMHGMEMHTAVEYDVPVTFVVFNNNAHAMCVTREQLFYEIAYSYNRFRPAHSARVSRAMFPACRPSPRDTHAELADALAPRPTPTGPRCHRSRLRPRRNAAVRCRSCPPRAERSNPRRSTVDDRLERPARLQRHPADAVPASSAIENSDREADDTDHHGHAAVGVSARPGLRRVLHGQRLHRLPAGRGLRVPGRHPQPGGVDLQPPRLHRDRRARAVGRVRPARRRRPRSTRAPSPTPTP